jgi:hypothetical protein
MDFAIVLSLFLILFLASVEFGFDWYKKHVTGNAPLERAGYDAIYHMDGGVSAGLAPKDLHPSVQQLTNNSLAHRLPAGLYEVEVVDNLACPTGRMGQDSVVLAAAHETRFALGYTEPSLGHPAPTAQTVRKCE